MKLVPVASVMTGAFLLYAALASAQDVSKGAQVFADQKCGVCHSVAGKGNAKGSLDAVGSSLSADEIRKWIVDAKGMTASTQAARKPPMKNYQLPKEDL